MHKSHDVSELLLVLDRAEERQLKFATRHIELSMNSDSNYPVRTKDFVPEMMARMDKQREWILSKLEKALNA